MNDVFMLISGNVYLEKYNLNKIINGSKSK